MQLHDLPLSLISEGNLQELKDLGIRESSTIEYKQALPRPDSDKVRFLAAVSSFANAAGGDLLYGIRAEDGIPVDICGVPATNVDADVQNLENLLRTGIDPRLSGVEIRPVNLANGNVVIAIRIPQSWSKPHMVRLQDHFKFYTRNSAGKHPMDVSELRVAFNLSDTVVERVRRFRLERLGNIVSGQTPVLLAGIPKIVLHIVPFRAFDPAARVDTTVLAQADYAPLLEPLFQNSNDRRHNFDGYLVYKSAPTGGRAESYVQVFRSGSVEAVDADLLEPRPRATDSFVPSAQFEEGLIQALPRYFEMQRRVGVEPPYVVGLSLLGVAGYQMGARRSPLLLSDEMPRIDRDDLIVPDLLVEHASAAPEGVLKPAFDAVWNASGFRGSPNYHPDGKWAPRR